MKSNLMLRTAVIVISLLMAITAFAIPAFPKWQKATLTDGTTINVKMVGDEHGHWYIDENGKALNKDADGRMYYANAQQMEKLKVHRKSRLSASNNRRLQRLHKQDIITDAMGKGINKAFDNRPNYYGSKKGLVILVNYSDKEMEAANTQTVFNNHFNKENYTTNGYTGSVHDYFKDQSYGQFNITFDVVGPLTLSKSYSYYGKNDENGDDLHSCEMVIEALHLADMEGVNFSDYDWDGDGEVEQVMVIYAGTGENRSYNESDIWPHEWTLTDGKYYGDGNGSQKIDGVTINTYCVSCELIRTGIMEGIGTACHEYSHCLGFPDTYDTYIPDLYTSEVGVGMMDWGIMCSGNYNGPNSNSQCPVGFSSFERWMAGWLEPVELNAPQDITNMPALDNEPMAYIVYNEGNHNEFFMLENRQPIKWDKYVTTDQSAHGMLIVHIDYDRDIWYANLPNDDPDHQRMTYMPADNLYLNSNISLAGDTYPGLTNNTAFTDTTTPSATLYNKNDDGTYMLGKPITKISESNGLISFSFMEGMVVPELYAPTDITNNGFTAAWKPVEGAKSYTLSIKEGKQGKPLLSEDFALFTAGINSDISSKLDSYTTTSGWYGQKVFCNNGTVKLGTSSSNGYIGTSPIKSESGVFTVYFEAMRYKGDNSSMIIWLSYPSIPDLLSKENGTLYVHDVTMTDVMTPYILTFKYNGRCSVRFDPGKRAYMDNIRIYDGELTAEDIARMEAENNEELIISGITDTYYKVTDLNANNYTYRVKAILSSFETGWSNSQYVCITPTDITMPEADVKSRLSAIYSISGQRMGYDASALPAGLYIIGNKKVVIR